MITPVAIANAVEQTLGLYPRIKWPNDLQLKGKKFAGILIEGEWNGDRPVFALVGVGVNVNFDPAAYGQLDRPATSLAIEKGRPLPREPLLAAIFASFERAFDGAAHPAIFRGWRSRQALLGRPVTVSGSPAIREPGGVIQGTAEDVDEDGALLVRLPGGDLRRFHAGEVSLRGSPAPPPRAPGSRPAAMPRARYRAPRNRPIPAAAAGRGVRRRGEPPPETSSPRGSTIIVRPSIASTRTCAPWAMGPPGARALHSSAATFTVPSGSIA